MKLLLLAQQFRAFSSGLGTYARGLVEGLVAAGHEVTLAVCGSEARETPGVRTVSMDFSPWNLTPFTRRRMGREFRRVLADHAGDHDLVHFLDAREACFLPPGGAAGKPVAGTVHDTYALDWAGRAGPVRARLAGAVYYRWLRRLERRTYRRLDAVLANSDHVRGFIERGYGVAPERVRVVRLGLPEAVPVKPERLPGDPAVLFVGGNFSRKGLGVLLEAVGRLSGELPGLSLHVVGGDRRRARFRRQAAALGLGDRVTFHGWTENERVRPLMAGADIFAMPSLVEAFGLVYLEAMREGTPVIATNFGGAAEAFADGEEALLVAPGDVDALAACLRRLATEPALATRLVEGGRAAAARFRLAVTVRETEAAYRGLLG